MNSELAHLLPWPRGVHGLPKPHGEVRLKSPRLLGGLPFEPARSQSGGPPEKTYSHLPSPEPLNRSNNKQPHGIQVYKPYDTIVPTAAFWASKMIRLVCTRVQNEKVLPRCCDRFQAIRLSPSSVLAGSLWPHAATPSVVVMLSSVVVVFLLCRRRVLQMCIVSVAAAPYSVLCRLLIIKKQNEKASIFRVCSSRLVLC